MKLAQAPQDVQMSDDFETSDFAIGDIAFIVDMFADKVYTHKERAVLRELSCNAHDAQIDAIELGLRTTYVPFKVHLPTTLEPFLVVRDYGTGLDDTGVRTVFAGIGISTKRDSNKVIGCYGIGSLSPYSLTDQFTVTSYHGGRKRVYSCYRDTLRKPVVALLTDTESDEASGLEVQVSVENRVGEFSNEAVKVFTHWEGIMPEINKKDIKDEIKELRDKFSFVGEDYGFTGQYGHMHAVMGNIAYRIPSEIDEFDCEGYLKFELGELSFDTARENLSLDDKTKAAIALKTEKVKLAVVQDSLDAIVAAPTKWEQAELAFKLSCGRFGRMIKSDLEKYGLPELTENCTYYRKKWRGSDKNQTKDVPQGDKIEYYLWEDRMGSRIRAYLVGKDNGFTLVVLTKKQAKECYIPANRLKKLSDLPKVTRQNYGGKGSNVKTFTWERPGSQRYGYAKDKQYWQETELEIDGSEIVYIEISRWQPTGGEHPISGHNSMIVDTFDAMDTHDVDLPTIHGLKTAFLKTKQFEKGNFIHLDEYVKREFLKLAPKEVYEFNQDDWALIKALHKLGSKATDHIVALHKVVPDITLSLVCKRFGVLSECKINSELQQAMDAFKEKYSMLSFINKWDIDRQEARGQTVVKEYLDRLLDI